MVQPQSVLVSELQNKKRKKCVFLEVVSFNNSRKHLLHFYCFEVNKVDFPQWPSYYVTDKYHLCFKMMSKSFVCNEDMFVKRQIKT